MYLKRKNKKKKIITIVLIILIGVGASYVALQYIGHNNKSDTPSDLRPMGEVDYSTPNDEQIQAGKDIKKSTVDQKNDSSSTPSQTTSLDVQITTATIESGVLYIRSQISGIHSEGSCALSLSKADSTTHSYSSGVQPLPQASTCKGFNIPVSELSSGTWKIKLDVIINNVSSAATSSVEV